GARSADAPAAGSYDEIIDRHLVLIEYQIGLDALVGQAEYGQADTPFEVPCRPVEHGLVDGAADVDVGREPATEFADGFRIQERLHPRHAERIGRDGEFDGPIHDIAADPALRQLCDAQIQRDIAVRVEGGSVLVRQQGIDLEAQVSVVEGQVQISHVFCEG